MLKSYRTGQYCGGKSLFTVPAPDKTNFEPTLTRAFPTAR
jgi:hypothetical protein